MRNHKDIKPLPFPVYFWTVFLLAVAGMINAAYLSISHYRVYTDIGYESFCAISRTINCDTVSQSPYSIFLGVPVPVWGMVGFVLFIVCLSFAGLRRAGRRPMWAVLFLLAVGYCLYSIVLAAISSLIIHSYCMMCLVSYAITFAILFYTWLVRRRFDDRTLLQALKDDLSFLADKKRWAVPIAMAAIAGVIALTAFFPVYWYFEPPTVTTVVPTGTTADGHPWIGAENAELVITEFTDYLCFQCNKTHYYLRKILSRFPGKIKIIHRHFPMDHRVNPIVKTPVHQGSGALALLAIYAGTQQRFWQMNDYLYSNARSMAQIDLEVIADAVQLDADQLARALNDPAIRSRLSRDIVDGIKLGISGTPTFVIDGVTHEGMIPEEILSEILP